MASLPFLKILATCDLPMTLALCSPTVSIWIFLANGLDIFLTFATVLRASAGVANLILTVMEQRAKVMGKSQVASIAKKGKDAIRKRHNKTN